MQAYAESHIGLVREENQDIYRLCRIDSRTALAVVCDGMGGAAGGKLAAEIAADTFVTHFTSSYAELIEENQPTPFTVQRVYTHAVYHANLAVFERAVAEPTLAGMGTTLTAACFAGDALFIANVGDSRAYLIRALAARQLTHDDSYVQQMIDEGKMTEAAARESDRKNLLTRALGPCPYVEFSFVHESLRKGDRVLLCSDGLSAYHTEESLAALAHPTVDLRAATKAMIAEACRGGGRDNITCVLAEV